MPELGHLAFLIVVFFFYRYPTFLEFSLSLFPFLFYPVFLRLGATPAMRMLRVCVYVRPTEVQRAVGTEAAAAAKT